MGSFNVACSVSSISIGYGDSIAYIPLEVSKHPDKIGDGNNSLIYSHCFYSPVTLPIFGTYDDYGRIEDIKRNTNVDVIETHFGEKIESVCNSQEHDVRPVSSGMFIHREIFDTLVEKCSQVDEWGKKEVENGEDYLSNHFDKFVRNIQRAKKSEKKYGIYSTTGITSGGWQFWLREAHNLFNFRDYKEFRKIYFPQVENGELKEELIQFMKFEVGMFAVNRFYFPAMNGYQCGNHYASKLLYQNAAFMMKKEIREGQGT